jgi:cephalosporin-C deacetylase-like acetyl esterase
VSNPNRREFITQTAALAAAPTVLALPSLAASAPSYAEEFPDMLLAYLAGQLNALAEKWDQERAKITTAAQLAARNRFVREKFREMVHGFPERTPLNPIVIATHQRGGYRVENVMFQSRPDFWVTGNLYVPEGRGPFPGIISPCGHYPLARMQPEYQCAYINLVLNGFVVLAYDPIGQGERRQYWNPQTNQTEVASSSTYEHSMPGQVLLLMGEDLTHYRIWDGMRAIDYLQARPEVDPQRVGCAGHSGGGTLTLFISALDERVACAVVNEGGTGHRWPINLRPGSRIGPSDVEQNLFPAAVYGIDQCDLHVAIAPRPLLALIENYSPSFLRAAEHIRARYQQFGVPEKFATEEATDPHAWTVKLRLAATNWLCRWFYNRPGPEREPEFPLEQPKTLYCTANGSLRDARQGKSIFTLLREKGERLPPPRRAPASPAELASFRRELIVQIGRLLHYERNSGPLGVRHRVTTARKGYQVEKIEFLSEPGIYIPVWIFLPERPIPSRPAILYVNEAGKEADGGEFGLLEKFARSGRLVAAIDVRGVGETRPPHSGPGEGPGQFGHLFDVETAMAYMAWYMDRSLFGMRVQDVVRSVDYLLSRPDVASAGVQVIGKGAGALWALYAAAMDSRILALVAERGLVSYASLTQVDRYLHGAAIFIRDVLLHFDLPQVAAALADRPLILLSPVDPMKRLVSLADVQAAYQWTGQAYASAGAVARFRILERVAEPDAVAQYLTLL